MSVPGKMSIDFLTNKLVLWDSLDNLAQRGYVSRIIELSNTFLSNLNNFI